MNTFLSYDNFLENTKYRINADKIKNLYLQNIKCLDDDKTQHFLSRLNLCYEDTSFDILKKSIDNQIILLEKFYTNYINNDISEITNIFLEKRKSINSYNEIPNDPWLKEIDKIAGFIGYSMLVELFNIISRLNMSAFINNDFLYNIENVIKLDSINHINQIYENPILFSSFPVMCVNMFYYTFTLNLIDLDENKFLSYIKPRIYNDTFNLDTKIYILTHIIIGKSHFYETSVNSLKYNWIFEFIDLNYETIIKTCKYDQVIEIGLIHLLCKNKNNYRNYKNYVISKIKNNFIQSPYTNNSDTLAQKLILSEHTNIIAILLLNEKKKKK